MNPIHSFIFFGKGLYSVHNASVMRKRELPVCWVPRKQLNLTNHFLGATFSVITSKFEDAALDNDFYDLIFSASAFHWVTEQIGYRKVFSILKSGGAFARFANHPFRDKEKPALSEEMDRIYKAYYYTYHKRKQETPQEYTEEQARQRALIAEEYGFTDIQYALFQRTRTFTAKEYRILLGTYSDHIAIDEAIRTEFFSKIEDAVNHHGGTITIYDTIDLQLARKP